MIHDPMTLRQWAREALSALILLTLLGIITVCMLCSCDPVGDAREVLGVDMCDFAASYQVVDTPCDGPPLTWLSPVHLQPLRGTCVFRFSAGIMRCDEDTSPSSYCIATYDDAAGCTHTLEMFAAAP